MACASQALVSRLGMADGFTISSPSCWNVTVTGVGTDRRLPDVAIPANVLHFHKHRVPSKRGDVPQRRAGVRRVLIAKDR